jgi:hypothetical protein
MLEKIKNILYDLTDVVLALVIIVVMFSIITWKITDSMAFNFASLFNDGEDIQNEELISSDAQENNPQEDVVIEEAVDSEDPSNNNDNTEPTEATEPDQTDDPTETNDSQETIVEEVTVEIDSGSTGYGIAKLLEEKSLINNRNDFIKRVEELGLGAKLRSGTYTFKTNNNMDEIIYKLSGQN